MTMVKEGLEKHLLDSMPSGAVAVDRENRILFVNRALARVARLKPQQWEGRPLDEFLQLLDQRFECPPNLALRLEWDPHDRSTRSREMEFREKGGDRVYNVREDSRPLRDAEGRIIGRLFVYHDMRREKEIDRMKSEFIAVASHELRTPMTSIKGSVDLILSGYAGDISTDTQELLEIAQKNCDRLVRLINDILDLAKIEAGQIRLKLEPLDLTDAVERSMLGVRALADQSEVRLTLDRPETLPLVEVDRDRIEQVVTNLLSNAIKYSPPKGEVRVELGVADGFVQCAVCDQGCGIPEDQLKAVFEKFQQVTNAKSKGGTGLGLAIVQALVNEHRGKIWVESKVNCGCRFVFRLPASGVAQPS